jgi:hypothetical protein
MRKSAVYMVRAQECRELARKMVLPDHRDQLLNMAETWEGLAADREALVRAHPDLFDAEEVEEPATSVDSGKK